MRWARPYAVVMCTVALTACSGPSNAPNAPAGFFPSVFSGAGFVSNAQLVNGVAVAAANRSLRFHAVVPRPEGWALVVRCYRGTVRVDLGGSTSGGRCQGTTGVIGGCGGGLDRHLTVTVDQAQPARWGIAIYRSNCPSESPAEQRIKASPTPQ